MTLDGVEQPDTVISLVDDHGEHSVEMRIHALEGRLRDLAETGA
jgi:hypothetical protein